MTAPDPSDVRQLSLEEALATVEELRVRVQRSDERLASFAEQVTHDLKTPLTTMSLSLDLIRDELEVGAAAEDLVPLISRALGASARMASMIDEVLAFARLDTTFEPAPVDLGKVAAEVVADLAARLEDVDLTIGELPVVPGDEALLRSLLHNLVSNAATFRSQDRPPLVTLTSSRVSDHWRITVADNGIGVPEDQRERVFEPMVRLDKRIDGVGLGLATCRRIVDAHRGVLGVSGSPEGGSTFWVELPAQVPAPARTVS